MNEMKVCEALADGRLCAERLASQCINWLKEHAEWQNHKDRDKAIVWDIYNGVLAHAEHTIKRIDAVTA